MELKEQEWVMDALLQLEDWTWLLNLNLDLDLSMLMSLKSLTQQTPSFSDVSNANPLSMSAPTAQSTNAPTIANLFQVILTGIDSL